MAREASMKFFTLAAAASIAILAIVTIYPPADVAAKCNPGRASQYTNPKDGWYRIPGVPVVNGVRAYIYNYDPYAYPLGIWPNGGHSTTWVMLDINATNNEWAQIGWMEGPQDYRYTVVQYRWAAGDSNKLTVLLPPQPEGIFSEYRVEYWGDFHFYVGNTYYGYFDGAFVPDRATIAGELTNKASQMAGGYNNPAHIQLSRVNFSGGWQPFSGTTYISFGYGLEFANQKYDSYHVAIWDRKCAQ